MSRSYFQTYFLPRFVRSSAIFQLSLNCLLSFILGATFSANVFTTPVEQSANPQHSLNGIWPFSIGLFFFLSTLVTVPVGIYLDSSVDVQSTLRKTGHISSAGFVLWMIAAFGVTESSSTLVCFGNAMLAIPLAGLCMLVIEHVTYWLPGRSGQAIGIVNVALGVGTICTASFFHQLLSHFPVDQAVAIASLVLAICTSLCTFLLCLPGDYATDEAIQARNERGPSMYFNFPKLTWRSMIRLPMFWLYIFIIVSKRMTFPLLSYFFRVGHTYGVSQLTLLRWFQISNLFSLIFNYFSSVGTDFLRTEDGPFCSGARNLAAFMLVGQVLGYAALTQLVTPKDFIGWVIAVSVTLTLTQAHLGIATLLAVDLFGRENMSLVFGIGGGPALGTGEGIATVIMAMVDGSNGAVVYSPRHYWLFYVIGAVWSVVALASMPFLRRNIRNR